MNWSYELDGMDIEIDNEQELREALEGDFGPEYQAVAAQIVEEERGAQNGPDSDFYDEREGQQHHWVADMEDQLGKLEKHLGRPITKAEEKKVVDGSFGNYSPDLVADYGEELAGRSDDNDERKTLMAEVYEEEQAKRAEEGDPVLEGVDAE